MSPCEECDISGPEAQRRYLESICSIEGPGRLECWGCPVRACAGWQNPLNPLAEETHVVALRAAHRLASRAKAISPVTQEAQADVVGTALQLAFAVADPEVQRALIVRMAAEAVLQDVIRDAVIKRQRQYTDRWAKGLKGRGPTQDDDANLDDLMYRAEADAAAEAYDCNAAEVLEQLAYFRGRRLVRRGQSDG